MGKPHEHLPPAKSFTNKKMKKSKSHSSLFQIENEEQIQGLISLTEEEKKEINRRRLIEYCKRDIQQLRGAIEEIKMHKNQWAFVKYARKIVMITHLITAVYILAEKSLRVLNTSLYRTVSHQLSFSQLMKSWMQNKFEQSNSLQNLKEVLENYHSNVYREYQEQERQKELFYKTPSKQLSPQGTSIWSSVLDFITPTFSKNVYSGIATNVLDYLDPMDSLSYFGDRGAYLEMMNDADINASSFNHMDNLKKEHYKNARDLFASEGFKSIARLFWKETLQSGSLIFLVYWFGKQNIRKRVFATIMLFMFNIYVLVFNVHSNSSKRFRTILRWNITFNLLSLIGFLLVKQHFNITTQYSDQKELVD